MTDAIYMIEPTQESFDKLIMDFSENDALDYDQYGVVHLLFPYPISTDSYQKLKRCPKLTSRINTMLDFNLDFKLWQDNVFLVSEQETLRQLTTLCSCLTEKPYLQY